MTLEDHHVRTIGVLFLLVPLGLLGRTRKWCATNKTSYNRGRPSALRFVITPFDVDIIAV